MPSPINKPKPLEDDQKKGIISAILAAAEAKDRRYPNLVDLDRKISQANPRPDQDIEFFDHFLSKKITPKHLTELKEFAKAMPLLVKPTTREAIEGMLRSALQQNNERVR